MNNKRIKKMVKKSNKSVITCFVIFVIIGFIIGFGSSYYLTRNDTFSLNGNTNITLNLNDEYKEEGVTVISYGKDLKDKVEIETDLDTSVAGNYTVIYTVKDSFKYKNIKRIRYITVVSEGENNG